MSTTDLTTGVTGKTLRFTWRDGPTEGKTHEHVFHDDGTVEWHEADAPVRPVARQAERPKFLDEAVASGIRLVSYRADSGYALTVVLNEQSGLIAGIASGDRTWEPVHGYFEVVGEGSFPPS